MYQPNDLILYGAHGACRIEGTATKCISGVNMEYYVLKPISGDNTTIYVPVQNEKLVSRMRAVLSMEELRELMRQIPAEKSVWIENEQERKAHYRAVLSGGDRLEIMRLIKGLYLHQKEQKAKGRKLHVVDERFFKEAEKILYHEFALVLHIHPEEVLSFLIAELGTE